MTYDTMKWAIVTSLGPVKFSNVLFTMGTLNRPILGSGLQLPCRYLGL